MTVLTVVGVLALFTLLVRTLRFLGVPRRGTVWPAVLLTALGYPILYHYAWEGGYWAAAALSDPAVTTAAGPVVLSLFVGGGVVLYLRARRRAVVPPRAQPWWEL